MGTTMNSKYPPVTEHITIQWETYSGFNGSDGMPYPFIRLDAVPARFHSAIHDLSLGSACPAPDDRRDSFYMHDIERWLRAIGVEATFIAPTTN